MNAYYVTTSARIAAGHVEITIHGPGLPCIGTRRSFASEEQAASWVEDLNFAFEQGAPANPNSKMEIISR